MPRLDLLIAHNLGLSRGQVTKLCRSGRVLSLEGAPMKDPSLQIPPSALPQTILLDGRPHPLHVRYHLLQHKPVGVVTALRDDRHPTAYGLIRDVPLARDLRAVGRLDLETSGLLLWTTEGPLLHRLTHPRYAVRRTYQAALSGPWRSPLPDLTLDDGHRPEILALLDGIDLGLEVDGEFLEWLALADGRGDVRPQGVEEIDPDRPARAEDPDRISAGSHLVRSLRRVPTNELPDLIHVEDLLQEDLQLFVGRYAETVEDRADELCRGSGRRDDVDEPCGPGETGERGRLRVKSDEHHPVHVPFEDVVIDVAPLEATPLLLVVLVTDEDDH